MTKDLRVSTSIVERSIAEDVVVSPIICEGPEIVSDVVGLIALEPNISDTIEEIGTSQMGDTVIYQVDIDTTALPVAVSEFEPVPVDEASALLDGDVNIVQVDTQRSRLSDIVKDALVSVGLRKTVKAYPNPVIAGQAVTIDFLPDRLGTYHVEVFDISGKRVSTRLVNIVYKKQSFQISTISSWAKGMYIVRLIGEGKDNAHQTKILVK